MGADFDGNAIAGLLQDVFGTDVTTAVGTCATCGNRGQFADTEVYLRGPGTVVRCRVCQSMLMVLVTVRSTTCVDSRGLAALDLQ